MNGQAMQQSDFFALGRTFVYLLTAKDPNQFYNPQTDELIMAQCSNKYFTNLCRLSRLDDDAIAISAPKEY